MGPGMCTEDPCSVDTVGSLFLTGFADGPFISSPVPMAAHGLTTLTWGFRLPPFLCCPVSHPTRMLTKPSCTALQPPSSTRVSYTQHRVGRAAVSEALQPGMLL